MGNACASFFRQAQNVSFYVIWASTNSALQGCPLTEDPTSEEAGRLFFFPLLEAKISKLVLQLCFQSHKFMEPKPPKWGFPSLCYVTPDVLVWPLSVQVVCLWPFLERADMDVQNESKEWGSAREIFSVQEKYCTSGGLTQYFWPKPLKSVVALC